MKHLKPEPVDDRAEVPAGSNLSATGDEAVLMYAILGRERNSFCNFDAHLHSVTTAVLIIATNTDISAFGVQKCRSHHLFPVGGRGGH